MRAILAILLVASCGCAVKQPTPAEHAQAAAYAAALQFCVTSSPTRAEADECKKAIDAKFGQVGK